ncbi:hypothetical protein GCM10020218_016370 [Dactylosporangium vinaceum]
MPVLVPPRPEPAPVDPPPERVAADAEQLGRLADPKRGHGGEPTLAFAARIGLMRWHLRHSEAVRPDAADGGENTTTDRQKT